MGFNNFRGFLTNYQPCRICHWTGDWAINALLAGRTWRGKLRSELAVAVFLQSARTVELRWFDSLVCFDSCLVVFVTSWMTYHHFLLFRIKSSRTIGFLLLLPIQSSFWVIFNLRVQHQKSRLTVFSASFGFYIPFDTYVFQHLQACRLIWVCSHFFICGYIPETGQAIFHSLSLSSSRQPLQ